MKNLLFTLSSLRVGGLSGDRERVPRAGFSAQPNRGVKVAGTFVVWSNLLIHQPLWSFVRQAARPSTERFGFVRRLPLTGQPPHNSGVDKLGSYLATQETRSFCRSTKADSVRLLASRGSEKRFCAFCSLRVGRLPATGRTSRRGGQPNKGRCVKV